MIICINIDLTVRAGEIVGVAGLEGAGKSALGRAIAGDEPFEHGVMEIAGKAVTLRKPRAAIEAGIGRLSEDRKREGLLMQQSLRDNATLIQRAFAAPFRAPGADTMSNPETDQRLIELDVRAASFEQEAGRLSGGNQQKVIVARWLARDPQVLVFSEPTRGIDVAAKAAIYKIMRDLADRGPRDPDDFFRPSRDRWRQRSHCRHARGPHRRRATGRRVRGGRDGDRCRP